MASTLFQLQLPAGFRATDVLAYHGRDPLSRSERVVAGSLFKALVVAVLPIAAYA